MRCLILGHRPLDFWGSLRPYISTPFFPSPEAINANSSVQIVDLTKGLEL